MNNSKDSNLNKKMVLIVITLIAFLPSFMMSSINVALPSMGREFALDAVLLSWVALSYVLTLAMFLVPFGRLADIYGQKMIFTLGVLIYTISSLLLGYSVSARMLISFRVLQGVGAAMTIGTRVAILSSVFPAGERGKAMGINVTAVYLGLSMGPFIGGVLTESFGWRSIFFINVPFGILAIVLVLWKLKEEWAEARGEKFDIFGSMIYGISIIATMYGLSLLPGLPSVWLLLIGVIGVLAFIKWEMKVENPVLDVRIFQNNPIFTFSNLAALIHYCAIFSVGFLLSLYMQYLKALSPRTTGLILVSFPAMQVIFAYFSGRLSDRVEPRILASAGMVLTNAMLVFLAFLKQNTTIVSIVISLSVLGLGAALFSSPNMNAVMSSVNKKFYGVASAVQATSRQLGMMFSMGITLSIFAIFIGRVEISPEVFPALLNSLRIAFITFAVLSFGGLFASLSRGKIR